MPARVGIVAEGIDELRHLIDFASVRRSPVAPLVAVDRTEFPAVVSPIVPDADAILLQIPNVGVAPQEPQQLVDDRAQMQLSW